MTLECGNCGSRYNIQDSLIPPQGARVKCKKCATVISIPAPVVELAPHDLELIPPSPAEPPSAAEPASSMETESPASLAPSLPPVPSLLPPQPPLPPAPSDTFDSSPFETSVQRAPTPRDQVEERAPEADIGLERYPSEPPPDSTRESIPEDESFERSGAPARFGSPPSFAESATAPSRGGAMTLESPMASAMPSGASPIENSAGTVEEEPAAPSTEAPAAAPIVAPAAAIQAPVAVPTSTSTSTLPTGTPLPEGLSAEDRSKHEKARRLARVLASDISIYNREKKERGIREGNLVAMLGYEIKKSWEIYKERVGTDFANSTPYFRDALNEMLAEGKKIF